MKWIENLAKWREERQLIKPQWDSIVPSLLEENQELKDAYNNNDYQEIIDAYADHIVFATNLLGQIDKDMFIFPKAEDIDNEVKSIEDINLYIKMLSSLIETNQHKLAMYVLKKIIWACKVNIEHLGYNFECVMDETIKEISSRQQEPEQKKRWKENGSNGEKWQKWLQQNKDTLYKANYNNCKKI
jgi:NTP pyrophosphatase (non-canonical NTP hydrolase)